MRKVATVEGRLVWFEGGITAGTLFPDRWTCIWHTYRQTESILKQKKEKEEEKKRKEEIKKTNKMKQNETTDNLFMKEWK